MKARASAPTTRVRTSTSHRPQSSQKTDVFVAERRTRPNWVRLLLGGVLVLTLLAAAGWLVVATPLWLILAVVAIAGLPFILTYLAIQFAGVLIALSERR